MDKDSLDKDLFFRAAILAEQGVVGLTIYHAGGTPKDVSAFSETFSEGSEIASQKERVLARLFAHAMRQTGDL